MQTIRGFDRFPQPLKTSVVTIGNFDGFHRGHQALIAHLKSEAARAGVPSVVMTFDPHPVQVLFPERELKKLSTVGELEQRLRAEGIDIFVVQPFSREFSQTSPRDFIEQKLVHFLHPLKVVVGYDFSFGSDRSGSTEMLRSMGQQRGFTVDSVSALQEAGQPISSRRIRDALQGADVELAGRLLGQPYSVRGIVIRGEGRGKKLGFPTANLQLAGGLILANGVYATRLESPGFQSAMNSVTNVGFAPTFAGKRERPLVECHVLDAQFDLYGREVQIEFLRRLREERKFSSIDELKATIADDVQNARRFLTEETP